MPITPDEVRAQLAKILNSGDFQASQRLKDFLSYIVEGTLNGKGGSLKAYSIAVDVFGLGENFDSRLNPLVRTEAGRLRGKLDHYYLFNPTEPVRITIPKGGYKASFARFSSARTNKGGASALLDAAQEVMPPQKVTQPEHKASILVLPFDNIAADPAVKYFIAGLSNEIVVGLTRFKELRVIAHSSLSRLSSLIQRGKGREPSVKARFVLGGGVLREGGVLKVWGFLLDSTTNYNIWAEKFVIPLEQEESASYFALQEDIAETVVRRIADDFGLLQRTLFKEFSSGASSSSSLQEAALLYHHWTTVLTKKDLEAALVGLHNALSSEPEHIPSLAMLADIYASGYQWSYNLVDNALEKSMQLAAKAVGMDPECQIAHLAVAFNHYLRGDKEKFLNSAELTLGLNPYSTNVLSALAAWYGISGLWDTALNLLEKLTSLSPTCPRWCYASLAMYRYMEGDYAASFSEAEKINMPETMWPPMLRLISGAFLDKREECAQALTELTRLYPNFEKNAGDILSRNMPNETSLARIKQGFERAGLLFI